MLQQPPRAASTDKRLIPPPCGAKQPQCVNVFAAAQMASTRLAPLFPFLGPGDIVPTCSVMEGGTGESFGYFMHFNTVDEVALVFGAGEQGHHRTGMMAVGANLHGVGGCDPNDANDYALATVTQRQREQGPQPEAIVFPCEKCAAEVFRRDYDGRDNVDDRGLATLPTIINCCAASLDYNASEERRTCPKCGHVNAPFPLRKWGWDAYTRQGEVAQRAMRKGLSARGG